MIKEELIAFAEIIETGVGLGGFHSTAEAAAAAEEQPFTFPAGGAISAGTSGILTAALGEAYIGIMSLVFNGEMSISDLSTKKGKDQMKQLFVSELSRKR